MSLRGSTERFGSSNLQEPKKSIGRRILQLKHARESRCELRGHIRIKHHDQPDDEGEKDAVLQRKPKEPAFIFPLHCRCGSGNGNTGQADHLSHHASGRVSLSQLGWEKMKTWN